MISTNQGELQLTDEERSRIGQTIVAGFAGVEPGAARELLETHRPAGVTLMPRNIRSAAQVHDLVAGLQDGASDLGLPTLLVAVDQEGGQVLRLGADAGFTEFPSAMSLAAGGDVRLARDLAAAIGRELSAVGVNLSFAPVLDLALEPRNRVIGSRSYGADTETVATFGRAVIDGLREAGVMACAKHYPGHGATADDSHVALPQLASNLDEARNRDLIPFQAAIEAGCAAIMTAHVVSALDPSRPVTISPDALVVLRQELRFDGLVMTDALEMRALAGLGLPPGRPGVEALRAGADLVLFDGDRDLLDTTVGAVAIALRRGELEPAVIAESARRLATARASLLAKPPPSLAILRAPRALSLAERAARFGVSVTDPSGILPFVGPPSIVDIDRGRELAVALTWPLVTVAAASAGRGQCVVAVTDDSVAEATLAAIGRLVRGGNDVLLVVLEGWQPPVIDVPATVLAFDLPQSQWAAIGDRLVAPRLRVAGSMDPSMAAIVEPALAPDLVPRAAPGAQLVADLGDKRVIDVAVGDARDGRDDPVTTETRFDLASITKIVTALAFLRLVENGVAEIDGSVRDVFPAAFGADGTARRITWRHLLSHASGLPAVIDLTAARGEADARARILAVVPDGRPGERVVYSDVGFMLLGLAVETLAGVPLGTAVGRLVLDPLGLARTAYRPDPSLPIAETEVCRWRRRRLLGEVHDENAAVLGGVAGHAGLFGTAQDVAKLGRCILDGGTPLLGRDTVGEMLREQARDGDIRRGLGVSLWSPDPDTTGHPFGVGSFGHTGFTGTSLWVDPKRRLVVALLTNTVFRGRDDRGLWAARIAVHRAIVEAADAQPAGRIRFEGNRS
jgi:serine-type D-Ala-D-Ala carboxypeptidase